MKCQMMGCQSEAKRGQLYCSQCKKIVKRHPESESKLILKCKICGVRLKIISDKCKKCRKKHYNKIYRLKKRKRGVD